MEGGAGRQSGPGSAARTRRTAARTGRLRRRAADVEADNLDDEVLVQDRKHLLTTQEEEQAMLTDKCTQIVTEMVDGRAENKYLYKALTRLLMKLRLMRSFVKLPVEGRLEMLEDLLAKAT